MADLKRWHILYSGRVQGVGFRQSVLRIARRHAVTGFVKNLDNGNVELVVEGESSAISTIEAAIQLAFKRNITVTQIKKFPATDEFTVFEIL